VQLRGGGKYAFGLAQSYPNPARERATIKYTLATAGDATLAVYDLTGRRVTTLATGNQPAGEHEVVWPLVGTNGAQVPAGVYIYRLEAGGDAATRRLVVSP